MNCPNSFSALKHYTGKDTHEMNRKVVWRAEVVLERGGARQGRGKNILMGMRKPLKYMSMPY